MARESLWTMKDYKKSIMQGILLLAMFAVVLFAEWRDFQLDRIENEKKISDNTVLFVCGFPGIDARMDFTDNEITKEEYASDTPQTAQQDTQYDQAARNEYFSDVPQCLWGKWVVTEKWVNNIYGWDANIEDERIGMSIELRPDSFGFGSRSDETMYYAHVMAVEDPWKWYEDTGIYWELGIRGDYYFVFQYGARQATGIFTSIFMMVSENEIVIPFTRYSAYKLEKAGFFQLYGRAVGDKET